VESELIRRFVRDGDPRAFGQLVELHQSAVRRFLRHLTRGNHAAADDLAQDTFLQAYRGGSRFRGDARFETWLLGIAYNHFRNWSRSRDAAPVAAANRPEAATPATHRLSDLQRDLAEAMANLSAEEQLALNLVFQFGLTHAEIAATLHWPLGTVKTHLARGKGRLGELLALWKPRT